MNTGRQDCHRSLRTDGLQGSLRRRAVRGGAITVTVQVIRTGLDLAAGMVMARLLTPADYGLVAMVLPVTGLIALFKDMGFSAATIQKEDILENQVSFIFWINLAIASILAVICAAMGPLVGRFYGDVRTGWIMLALAGTFVLGGLTTQFQALLTRQMRFGTLAIIDLLTTVTRTGVGISTAWMGWSYWSLVAMTISGTLINCSAVWMADDWRPSRPKMASGMRSILGFGGCLTLSRLFLFVSGNTDKLLIGKLLGATPLGLYNRGFQLLLMPVEQIYTPASSVMLAALSRLAGHPTRYRKAVRELAELMILTITPVSAILISLAPEAVYVLLGPAWMAAVPIFRGLAIAAVALPINYLCGIILQASGRTDAMMRWTLVTMLISVASIVLGLHWGVVGVAYCWSTGVLLLRTPGFYLTVSRNTEVSFMDLLMPVASYAIPFVLIVAFGELLRRFMPGYHPWTTLLLHGGLLSTAYLAYLFVRGKHQWLAALLRTLNSDGKSQALAS